MKNTSRIPALFIAILTLPLYGVGDAGIFPYGELRERLFVSGRPIGQPLSSKRPDVRIVRVDSRHEADSIFSGICVGCHVVCRTYRGEEWLICRLPPRYGGYLCYTHRPLPGWRVVGTVYMRSTALNRWGFTEVRFVETVKKNIVIKKSKKTSVL